MNGRCQEQSVPKQPEPVVGECPPCKPNEECDVATLTCFPGESLSNLSLLIVQSLSEI